MAEDTERQRQGGRDVPAGPARHPGPGPPGGPAAVRVVVTGRCAPGADGLVFDRLVNGGTVTGPEIHGLVAAALR